MTLILLDNDFSANTIPNAAGLFAAGTRQCSAAGHLAFAAYSSYALPPYAAGNNIAGKVLVPICAGATPQGLQISGPAAPDAIPALAAGLCYKFEFWLAQSTPPFNITLGGQNVFSFLNYNNSGMQVSAGGSSSTILSPYPNQTAASSYGGTTLEPLTVTLVIRQAVGAQWEVETWVENATLSLYPVCLCRQVVTLASSVFAFQLFDTYSPSNAAANSTWTADIVEILSIQIASNFDLDPTASGYGYFEHIVKANGNALICNGYANYQGMDIALLSDEQWDGSSNARNRLFTSMNQGRTWVESLFSGHDQYGNASAALALFDVDKNAPLSNVTPTLSVTRTLLGGSNFSMGNTMTNGAVNMGSLGAAPTQADYFGPFTASSSGTVSALNIVVSQVTGSQIQCALCNYSGNPTSPIGTLVTNGLSALTTINGTAGAYTSCPLSGGGAAVVAGNQYVLVCFNDNGGSTSIGPYVGTGGTSAPAGIVGYASLAAFQSAPQTTQWYYSPGSFMVEFNAPVVATAGSATAAIAFLSNGGIRVTIADSGGTNATFDSGTYTSVSTLAAAISAIAGGAWTATVLTNATAPADPNCSSAGTSPTYLLQNTAAPVNCNGTAGILYRNQSPINMSMGCDPATGVILAVTERNQSGQCCWVVGRFYDGTMPYDKSHWGPEFIIAGGPLNGGAAHTGGDGFGYGDIRSVVKLADGRWLVACECGDLFSYPGSYGDTQPVALISKPGLTPAQIAAGGSIQGYAYNGGSPTWAATPAWTYNGTLTAFNVTGSPIGASAPPNQGMGVEPAVDQLANGQLICVARNAMTGVVPGFATISIGTLNAGTGQFTWADPTDSTGHVNSAGFCICDGGVRADNGFQRPFIWSGNAPLAVASDNIKGTLYVVTPTKPYGPTRGWNTVLEIAQSNLLPTNIATNGGIRIGKSPYGVISTGLGGYPSCRVNNGVLCGTFGNGTGASFFRGKLDGLDVQVPNPSNVLYGSGNYGIPGSPQIPNYFAPNDGVHLTATSPAMVVSGLQFGVGNAASGTYPTTATSQAAQLAIDEAAVLASAAFIVSGAIILGQTGTYVPAAGGTVPHAADVRYGVTVGSTTGTCYVPSASNVVAGVPIDATTGSYPTTAATQAADAGILAAVTLNARGTDTPVSFGASNVTLYTSTVYAAGQAAGGGGSGSFTMQNIRDAMALPLTTGITPAANSIDFQISTTVTPLPSAPFTLTVLSGSHNPSALAGTWQPGGTYNGLPYWTFNRYFAWWNGTRWYLSTALGTSSLLTIPSSSDGVNFASSNGNAWIASPGLGTITLGYEAPTVAIASAVWEDSVDTIGGVPVSKFLNLLLSAVAAKTLVNATAGTIDLLSQDGTTSLATLTYDPSTPGSITSAVIH